MKLAYYRRGFATNSSSSHSIILGHEGQFIDENNDGEYGWGD